MNLINENLKYFDNYLNPNILKKMYNKLIDSRCPWHRQVSDNVNSLSFWLCPISNLEIFSEETKYLKDKVDKKVLRIYANGQTYTQHGEFHKDDGDETILIGMNENLSTANGGATEFLCERNTSICIYPIYNRAIFFNSQIKHRALPCLDKTFRITLAIKTTT